MDEKMDKKAIKKEAKRIEKEKKKLEKMQKRDGRQIHNPEIEEISKISQQNEGEKKKIKLSKKSIKIIVSICVILFVILVIVGKIETEKRDHAKSITNSLNSFMNGKYVQANIDLKDVRLKTDGEKALNEIVILGKDIPAKSEYFMDVNLIKEYISVLEKMKEVVKNNGGSIELELYMNKKYKTIYITEVAFDDAIRFANEKIDKLNEKDELFNKKSNSLLVQELDIKTIGFFIRQDNIKGVGNSYYDK